MARIERCIGGPTPGSAGKTHYKRPALIWYSRERERAAERGGREGGGEVRESGLEELTLADLPARAARMAPDRIAVIAPPVSWTFSDLHCGVRRATTGLERLGLGTGDRTAILLPNGVPYLQAFFGVSSAGGVIVPVSTFLAPVEAASVLEDSRSRCLITTERRLAALVPHFERLTGLDQVIIVPGEPGARVPIPAKMRLNEWAAFTARDATTDQQVPPSISDVAILTYTSGTTGKMKGVMLTHANLMANARSCLKAVEVRSDDRLLLFLPMFHSLTQLVCIVAPALATLSVVLLPGVDRAAITTALRKHRPTIFLAVPAIYAAMADRPPGFLRRWLNPVRLYICGGAPLPRKVLESFEAGWRRPLCEGYGLSEAAPVVCLNPVDGVRKPGSVGLPLSGVEVRILAEDGYPAPAGATGEIAVRGRNVMLGYHGRPEETAAALRDGWLHTGDLGHVDEEGYLFIAGRRKEMLIFRGLNVYPREIEDVLAAHPDVAEAAVVGLADPRAGETPHAAVVLRSGSSVSEKDLRRFCAGRLARYKVPRSVTIMAEFPRNATGKVMKDDIRESIEESSRRNLTLREEAEFPDA
jgi:long-chain acyl-CoA synthetase